jgi:uncharacterized protein (UPF0335 family)
MSTPFDDDTPGDLEHDASTNGGDVDVTHLNKDAKTLLRAAVAHIEDLESQKHELGEDIKEQYLIAKTRGLDTKTIRQIVRRRKMDRAERERRDTLLELYEGVFG